MEDELLTKDKARDRKARGPEEKWQEPEEGIRGGMERSDLGDTVNKEKGTWWFMEVGDVGR